MKTSTLLVLSLVFVGCGSSSGRRGARHADGDRFDIDSGGVGLRASLEENALLRGSDGEVYVGVWLDAPEAAEQDERPPLAVSLVIDRSGSMQGDAIVQAREAATRFLHDLKDGDIVSIYAFDDEVSEIVAPTALEPPVRDRLVEAVAAIRPGGSTNLHGGLTKALDAIEHAPDDHPVRRIFVLSDGRANIGPSSAEELGTLAARASDLHAQVTTLGLGLEYDEATLGEIAMRSAGRYHHIAEATELSAVLERELSVMDDTVAFDTVVEIVPADGIEVVSCEGLDLDQDGDRSLIRVGSLSAGQSRHLLVRMRADTDDEGEKPFAAVRLRYKMEQEGDEAIEAVALTYRVTTDAGTVDESRNDEVAALSQQYQNARVQQQAAAEITAGNAAAAADTLDRQAAASRAAAGGMAAPAAAPLQAQARDLEERARRVRRANRPEVQREEVLEMNDSSMDAMGF
jgi:Ca-activated chloride channel family protein